VGAHVSFALSKLHAGIFVPELSLRVFHAEIFWPRKGSRRVSARLPKGLRRLSLKTTQRIAPQICLLNTS
jgi:hypothetical protein